MDSAPSHNANAPSPQVVTASGPGSRITVVCAECKRLKLKCDRRSPCSSCTKRDAVSRCVYSAAAAERIDLQSLHNRVVTLESTLQSLVSSGLRRPGADASDTYDRTVLATSSTTSSPSTSIVVSLEDVASVWLDQLEVLKDGSGVEVRVSPPEYLPTRRGRLRMAFPEMDLFVEGSPSSSPSHPSSSLGDNTSEGEGEQGPCVTLKLLQKLPPPAVCKELLTHLEGTMRLHPSFNFPNFRRRVEGMFDFGVYSSSTSTGSTSTSGATTTETGKKRGGTGATEDVKPTIGTIGGSEGQGQQQQKRPTLAFFAAAVGGLALGARTAMNSNTSSASTSTGAATGAGAGNTGTSSPPQPNTHPPGPSHSTSNMSGGAAMQETADGLFMLSKQALAVSEFEAHYDLDFIAAIILHGLFLLHDGKPRVAHTIYPTVGKLINISRMMGLHIDPDEFPGKYSLFDAEARRRAWWDVYYYDLFLSDSMGQDPLIDDEACTTRMPADVDDDAFHPGSTSLPPPSTTKVENNSAYFIQKCRLAQLIKTMRRRWVAEQITMEMWLEAAAEFETEINTWLDELPAPFRIPARAAPIPNPSLSSSSPGHGGTGGDEAAPSEISPYLIAQRCELAAMANSLILKAYTPLLKRSMNRPHQPPLREAQLACSTAAHIIVNAAHDLFAAFGTSRPAAYVFYSFGRQIFAAAAISASIVIQQPKSLVAEPAMRDLERALELMRHPVVSGAKGYGYYGYGGALDGASGDASGVEQLPSSSLHIVQLLYKKACDALSAGGSSGAAIAPSSGGAGTKRKHGELDTGGGAIPHGFTIPFVGSSLVTGPSNGHHGTTSGNAAATAPHPRASSPPPSGPGPNKSRLRSATGTTTSSRRGGVQSSPSDTAPTESLGTATRHASNPSTRTSPDSMAPPREPTSASAGALNLTSSSTHAAKKKSGREKHKHPAIGVRNRNAKSSAASRSQHGEGSVSGTSEGTSVTAPSVVGGPHSSVNGGGLQYRGGVAPAASVGMSESSSRGPQTEKVGGGGPGSSSTISYSTPADTGAYHGVSASSSGMASGETSSLPPPLSMRGYSGHETTQQYTPQPQYASAPPSLYSASGEFAHPAPSTTSSPGNGAFMLTSSPYGAHAQPHHGPPQDQLYGSSGGSGTGSGPPLQEMSLPSTAMSASAAPRSAIGSNPPTPMHAYAHPHHSQPHYSSPASYNEMMHGAQDAQQQQQQQQQQQGQYSTQPTGNSPLGGSSFTPGGEIDMKPFAHGYAPMDPHTSPSGPGVPSSATSYGGDGGPAGGAQWAAYHGAHSYTPQPMHQRGQPSHHPQHHPQHQQQPPPQNAYSAQQHWNADYNSGY